MCKFGWKTTRGKDDGACYNVLCKAKTGCVNLGGRLQGLKMMVTNLFPVLTGQTLTGCGNLGGRLQGAKVHMREERERRID